MACTRGISRRRCSRLAVHHLLQIVDVVQKDVGELAHGRLHIAGHGDVDDKKGAVAPHAHRGGHNSRAQDGVGGGCGADHNVGFPQRLGQPVPAQSLSAELFGQPRCPPRAAVHDQQRADAIVHQVLGCQLGHLTGADEQDGLGRQIIKDLKG